MTDRSVRDHATQLAHFAEQSEAKLRAGGTDWFLPIVANNHRAAAQAALRSAAIAEAVELGELVEWRFVGSRLHDGKMPLEFLAKLASPLNNLLLRAAFFARTGTEAMYSAADDLGREMALSLVGLEAGSTRLLIRGNASPDTTNVSALSIALDNVFAVLDSTQVGNALSFFEHLDDLGERASEALHETLKAIESEECSLEVKRFEPSGAVRVVQATYDRVVQMRALLDGSGDVAEGQERLSGLITLLSTNGRIQLTLADGSRATVRYKPRTQAQLVESLTLNAAVELDVRAQIRRDPITGADIKRYSLLSLEAPLLGR